MIPKLRQERHLPLMANTYTQIYLHVVFAVEGRQNLIPPEHNDELQKYTTGIISGKKQKLITSIICRTMCISWWGSNRTWRSPT